MPAKSWMLPSSIKLRPSVPVPEMPLTVTGLLGPHECEIDEQYGITATGRDAKEPVDFPLAEIEVMGSSPSLRMVRDYTYWFRNWR